MYEHYPDRRERLDFTPDLIQTARSLNSSPRARGRQVEQSLTLPESNSISEYLTNLLTNKRNDAVVCSFWFEGLDSSGTFFWKVYLVYATFLSVPELHMGSVRPLW